MLELHFQYRNAKSITARPPSRECDAWIHTNIRYTDSDRPPLPAGHARSQWTTRAKVAADKRRARHVKQNREWWWPGSQSSYSDCDYDSDSQRTANRDDRARSYVGLSPRTDTSHDIAAHSAHTIRRTGDGVV